MSATLIRSGEKDLSKFEFSINQLAAGRSNAVGSFSLTISTTTTAVTAINCGTESIVVLMPKTANAAAEIGNGTAYVSSVGKGTFTVTHANNSQADRAFGFIALG